MRSEAQIREHLRSMVAEALGVEPEDVDVDADLAGLGLSSIRAFHLVGDVAEWLDRDLSPTLMWEYPTLRAVATALAAEEPTDG